MKRYGNLYEKIITMENLREAHRNARKDKLFYEEVKMVDRNPEKYLKQIQDMLITGTYKVSEYTVSILKDKGKERELRKLPYFPDRIVQWAIMLQVEPIFMEVFISSTCASIKGRGIHKASEKLVKYMETDPEGTQYCYKIDVRKFYPSINHTILKKLLRKKLKDEKLLSLLDTIIDSTEGDTGIPIGSYLSQYLANYYLAYFDHWIKEEIGIKYYIRYMDDIVILHSSKEYLHELHTKINQFFTENLLLNIKDNWQVFPTAIRGVDFVGYRHFYGYKLLRKTTCKRFKKKMLKIKKKMQKNVQANRIDWSTVNSYHGWLVWCDGYRLKEKYVKPVEKFVEIYYINIIKGGLKNACS